MGRLENREQSGISRESSLYAGTRALLAVTMAAGALTLTGCGPGDGGNNGGQGGSAGVSGHAGEGGTGGTEGGAGGTAGTGGLDGGTGGEAGAGGSDPCKSLTFNGLASRVYQPGETGAFTVSLGAQHPDKAYNDTTFTMVSGDLAAQKTAIGLVKEAYNSNQYQTPYGPVGPVSGIEVVAYDPDQPYVYDQNIQDCALNLVDVNDAVLSNPAKQPTLESPMAMYSSELRVENSVQTPVPFTLLADRTRFAVSNLSTKSHPKVDFLFANSLPIVPAGVSAVRDANGFITVDLAGVTDEGDGSANILSKLGLTAPGVTFAPVSGQPGKFRTTAASNLTSLDLSVAGANQSWVADTTLKSGVTVTETDPCQGVNCNGHGTCVSGACNCDPGFANNDSNPNEDCDGCDLQSGLYNNDYPVCSPDVTPPNAPVITTNGGANYLIEQADFILEGTTDADTYDMWQNMDGGVYSKFPYTHYSINWLYNGNIPSQFSYHDYCFKASDKAGNLSTEDCIHVDREN